MKYTNLALAVALSLGLAACGSDRYEEPDPTPPESDAVAIDEATGLTLSVTSASADTGTIGFSLATDDGKPVVGLTEFTAKYLGFPDDPDSRLFNLAWHQTHVVKCSADGCAGALEMTSEGQYRFTPDDYDWDKGIETLQYALELSGAQAAATVDFTTLQ